MTLETDRQKVFRFFEKFIDNYIVKDLTILQSIQPDKETGMGGCTIATAMTIISSMELLGFLLNPNGETGKSKDNISYFLYFPNEKLFPDYYDNVTFEKIYNYRHGMMHHFFPKFKGQFAGICKNENTSELYISHEIDGVEEESLNVNVLAIDFLHALSKLKDFLQKNTDEKIFDTVIKGLKNLDFYFEVHNVTTTETTINPGTPKNK